MMRELTGFLRAGSVLGALFLSGGGCTPTDRNFASGGAGGTGGTGGQGGGCPAGFVECDGNPETVCETDTNSSLEHCGACNNACAPALDADIACVSGKCSIPSCSAERGNCDNFYDNGCETNTNTSADHCGTCGNSCEAPDAITGCVAGVCEIANCVNGRLDCDMDPKTGCEVDPTSNVDHCGGCGMACPAAANAAMTCMNSQCAIASCSPGFGDCNVEIQDGCEAIHANNPYHCGSCGKVCKDGGCKAGACELPVVLSAVSYAPGELAIFKDALFVASRSAGEISRVDATLGGPPTYVVTNSVGVINSIDVSANAIFVAGSGGTMRMDWTGVNQYSYGTGTARGIAADTSLVYWTSSTAPLVGIRSGPVGGGSSSSFTNTGSSPYGIARNSDNIYWGLADGTIWTSTKSPIAPKNLGEGPNIADNLALDLKTIYWSTIAGLYSMPIEGGPITNLALGTTIRAIAVDSTHVYWTDESPGLVQRMLKDGTGPVEIVAIDQAKPWGIVVTSTSVIWANGGSGQIMKFAK